MNDSVKFELSSFKEYFFKSKKYWSFYLLLILIVVLSLFGLENYHHPKFEIFTI